MRTFFRDPVLQSQFETDGFVKIPLLNAEQVAQLVSYYNQHAVSSKMTANTAYGMVVSQDFEAEREKYRTIDEIRRIVLPQADRFFQQWESHLGSFVVKHPDTSSVIYPHRDWTFIDKQSYPEAFSMTLWIALGDYRVEQGSLGLIKGSHRFFPESVRCSPQPTAATATDGHQLLLSDYISFPSLQAGDAIAFNNETYHGSLPNSGGKPRLALTVGFRPAGIKLHHYFLKPTRKDTMLKLAVLPEFYLHYGNATLQKFWENSELPGYCKIVDELPYSVTVASAEEVEGLCQQAGNIKNHSMFRPATKKIA